MYWTSNTTGWLIPLPLPSARQFFVYESTSGGEQWEPVTWAFPQGRSPFQVLSVGTLVPYGPHQALILLQWGDRRSGWQVASWSQGRIIQWSRVWPDTNIVVATNTAERRLWLAEASTLWSVTASPQGTLAVAKVTTHLPCGSDLVGLQLSSRLGWALTIGPTNHPVLWTTEDGGRAWHRVGATILMAESERGHRQGV
ncbi:MAG: hypothetical protein OWU84_04325 [Firmicutes bacterium]|nr:hypothetical protein [Bacillota bacterium]